ncbi:hypothetical protein Brsp07_01717 [Brucella sp. NBRC 14130]|uniref:tripartite tricarboxylate transporter TctB family protein n=1 Tax=Brucella sp. NBRC 14130 TaxID=3075483 RepID=UPI0030991D3A
MNPARFVPYALSGIGLGAAASGLRMHLWESGEPAAGLFPFLAALLLIVTSLLCTTQGVVPDEDPIEIPRVIAYCVVLALFCVLLEVLGFVAAAFLFLSGVLLFIERMKWQIAGLLSAAVAVATWVLFEILLSVPLPHGIWRL